MHKSTADTAIDENIKIIYSHLDRIIDKLNAIEISIEPQAVKTEEIECIIREIINLTFGILKRLIEID